MCDDFHAARRIKIPWSYNESWFWGNYSTHIVFFVQSLKVLQRVLWCYYISLAFYHTTSHVLLAWLLPMLKLRELTIGVSLSHNSDWGGVIMVTACGILTVHFENLSLFVIMNNRRGSVVYLQLLLPLAGHWTQQDTYVLDNHINSYNILCLSSYYRQPLDALAVTQNVQPCTCMWYLSVLAANNITYTCDTRDL